MSTHTPHSSTCTEHANPCSGITLLLEPKEKDIGDFSVRRVLPSRTMPMVGPWIFFDHMGPAHFKAGKGINVRPHPHINLATGTYLFEGEIFHRDSLGNALPIRPGDINLMVAGSGITHSERERPEVNGVPHSLNGLQLWHALPSEHEETPAAFYHHPGSTIPQVDVNGVPVRVMMGTAYGVTSPVKTFAETLYLEAHLQAGQTVALPHSPERGLYVVSGSVNINGVAVHPFSMGVLEGSKNITVEATQPNTRIALVGGAPVGERFIEWNFVSSRRERIQQAKTDWEAGNFPPVIDDTEEFIPLPRA